MKEHYLHYLWKNKLIPFHKLQLKDGSPFHIKDTGKWNRYAGGPDFLDAQIEMYGLTWVGHVEIHVNSMDWYDHNHHLDDAYKAVILHVVYRSNGKVLINNQRLPELELIDVVNEKHFQSFGKFKMKPTIYCSKHVAFLDKQVVKRTFEMAFRNRIEKKTFITENQLNDQDLLHMLFAKAFGGKLNAEAFKELIRLVPLNVFFSLSPEKRKRVYPLVSGLYNAQDAIDYELLEIMKVNGIALMSSGQWTQGGIYSSASPKNRVRQFPVFLETFFHTPELGSSIAPMSLKNFIGFMSKRAKSSCFPVSFISHLFVNAMIPFFYIYLSKRGYPALDTCKHLLVEIPPEKNHIIKLWKNAGIYAKNAFESQALLEIFTDFCTNKKCLSCEIGNKILHR